MLTSNSIISFLHVGLSSCRLFATSFDRPAFAAAKGQSMPVRIAPDRPVFRSCLVPGNDGGYEALYNKKISPRGNKVSYAAYGAARCRIPRCRAGERRGFLPAWAGGIDRSRQGPRRRKGRTETAFALLGAARLPVRSGGCLPARIKLARRDWQRTMLRRGGCQLPRNGGLKEEIPVNSCRFTRHARGILFPLARIFPILSE
ncbi:hypothetical protein [Leisingera sp.]|uniref:hypothetical protein n=1 Tax=Leisingera sp. TaxID=1879318 RepID=UPI002B27071B|nr:hypothetical protein [Leisingera sp.]